MTCKARSDVNPAASLLHRFKKLRPALVLVKAVFILLLMLHVVARVVTILRMRVELVWQMQAQPKTVSLSCWIDALIMVMELTTYEHRVVNANDLMIAPTHVVESRESGHL